jgi:hypothetical protein
MVLYPYWCQRERWSKALTPPATVAVVWCDPRLPEGDFIEGWLVGSGEKLTLKDGQRTDVWVLVAAYPEFDEGPEHHGSPASSVGVGQLSAAPQYERLWQLKWIHIYDDHEPDWLEPPEFYVKANYGAGWEETSITPPVNNTSPWTLYDVCILDLGYSGTQYAKLEVWEDDWGSGDDLVEKYWDGEGCSIWIPLSEYEQRFDGCGSGDVDVRVQVVPKNPS